MKKYSVALAGNPNVGKSTIFNALTGLKQHTGNWTGKTVDCFEGQFEENQAEFFVTDLPGAYSLISYSREEAVTAHCLRKREYDCVILVLDAGALERNLCFALEVLSLNINAVICLNLTDEAEQKGIIIDDKALSEAFGLPVVRCCAVKKQGIKELKAAVNNACEAPRTARLDFCPDYSDEKENLEIIGGYSRQLCSGCITRTKGDKTERDRRLDRMLTSKALGIPVMLLLCGLLFWITVAGANYPSEWLNYLFGAVKNRLDEWSAALSLPPFLAGLLIDGVYSTLTRVIAVMLPPMAIFFPLFSLLEDSGYMPRIAFNLDRIFSRCGAHGKQSLCMMMGIGCNACGVTGCRIIENKKERLIAVITNNFMPCNGRMPILIALLMMCFSGAEFGFSSSFLISFSLVGVIACCVIVTLLVSKLLSALLKSGGESGFVLELPPFRRPQIIKTLARSFWDRTLIVLGRAVVVAAPAGAIIWLCANIYVGEASILKHCTDFLDPFGRFLGLDGVIIMAFILGFPANETVIPIIIMSYSATGALTDFEGYNELFSLLSQNGWTITTVVCMIIMTVMHFPCSTTCLTIKKETGSIKWTLLSMAVPTVCGIALCAVVSHIMGIFA